MNARPIRKVVTSLLIAVVLAVAALGLILVQAALAAPRPPFTQIAKLTASDGAADDYFGFSVAVSGDIAVVGAYGDDDEGNKTGAAYIFERGGGGPDNWGLVKKITATDAAALAQFGWSVALDGDTLAVGSPGENVDPGAVYIFERNQGGPDNWEQVKKVTASGGVAEDLFGYSVAIDGGTIVVGDSGDDYTGANSGSAYVFERDWGGADNWGQVAKIAASDTAAGDEFGIFVAIDGDTVIVGAIYDDSGSAYVFERDQGGADNWGQVAKLNASDGVAGDLFGFSIGVSGDTVAVGAPGDDDTGADSGSAYLFERDQGGPENWGQVKKITVTVGAAGDLLGHSVAIRGGTLVAGAPDGPAGRNGALYVFERDEGGANNWGWVKTLAAQDGAPDDRFAFSIALDKSEDTILGGAIFDDDQGADSGSAYVYRPMADVALLKSVQPSTAAPGERVTYTLTFTNAGGSVAGGVVITDVLPLSLTNTSVISTSAVTLTPRSGTTYAWDVADLPEGQGGVITISGQLSVTLDVGHRFTNTAVITTTAVESTTLNNTGSAGVTVSKPTLVWDGSQSSDWHDSDNWTPPRVPRATDDARGPGGPVNQPLIGAGQNGACDNLTIESGASLALQDGTASLTVGGTLANSGALRQTSDVGGNQTIDFLQIGDGSGGYSYYGVQLEDTSGSGLGATTVEVLGGQTCPAAPDLGNPPILRCFDITPTSQNTATLRFYYLTSELNGNDPATVNVYHQAVNGNWDMEQGTYSREPDGGVYDWVGVTGVDEYSPFTAGNHGPTLIDLASFNAAVNKDGVLVAWETASEVRNAGFNVYRADSADGAYVKLNDILIPARGGPTQGAAYSFEDATAEPGVTYYYKLEDVDDFGLSTFHGPVEARPSVPTSIALRCLAASPVVIGTVLLLALGAGSLVLLWRKRRG